MVWRGHRPLTPPEVLHLEADPLQMRQLLQNLASNGLKFRRPGVDPVVEVSPLDVRRALGIELSAAQIAELLERLADDLGFASASHFSRFFKRWTGSGPRDWRARVRAQAASGAPQAPLSYADWP